MKWTSEQKSAIEAPQGSNRESQTLLVAAAAGSGKTAVLVERIVQLLIKRKLSVQDLLVVTFTKAAAAEMRTRIGSKLAEVYQETGDEYIEEQLNLLPSAQISTLHSFCQWVIKNYFYKLDMDPNFRIGNEGELALLRDDVLTQVLRDAYANGLYCASDLADMFRSASVTDDDRLKEAITSLYHFAMAQADPKGWLAACLAKYDLAEGTSLRETSWGRQEWTDLQEQLANWRQLMDKTKTYAYLPDNIIIFKDQIQANEVMLQALETADSWDSLVERLATLLDVYKPKQFRKKKASEGKAVEEGLIEPEGIVQIISWQKTIRAGMESLVGENAPFSCTEADILASVARQKPYVEGLVSLVTTFMDAFQAAKQEENLVDFNDLEHMCLQLLRKEDSEKAVEPSDVALELQDHFKAVMVDEYQDTNGVQETIINLVGRPDNRFYVGDVKQSIYKFRMADPDLFIDKYKHFSKEKDQETRRIDLKQNFRSDRTVLQATNFIFRQVMTPEGAELAYGDEEALYAGRDTSEVLDNWIGGSLDVDLVVTESLALQEEMTAYKDKPSVLGASNQALNQQDEYIKDREWAVKGNQVDTVSELMDPLTKVPLEVLKEAYVLESDKEYNSSKKKEKTFKTNGEEETAQDELEADEMETAHIISRIKTLMAEGKTVQDGDRFRPLEWRDIAILLRSTAGRANRMVEAMRAAGIPAYAEERAGYFSMMEVQLLLALLQIIDNPQQDLPMAIVLRSFMVGLRDNDLLRLRMVGAKGMTLWDNLPLLIDQEGDTVLAGTCRNFLLRLEDWRTLSRRETVSQLLWQIFQDTGFLSYVGALPDGMVRKSNVEALYNRAKEYEAGSFRGLFRFLRFIEHMQKSGQDLGLAKTVSENENVVRIMTIHKSKGLEFPLVFLAGTQKKFNDKDWSKSLLMHKTEGIALKEYLPVYRLLAPTLPWMALKKRLTLAAKAEEERVLYVALTRARDKLIITGTAKEVKNLMSPIKTALDEADVTLSKKAITGANSYLQWILMALSRHIDCAGLRSLVASQEPMEGALPDIPDRDFSLHMRVYNGLAYQKEQSQGGAQAKAFLEKVRQGQPIEGTDLRQDLQERLDFTYSHTGATQVPAKISVTEIKRRFAEREEEAADETSLLVHKEENTSALVRSSKDAVSSGVEKRFAESLTAISGQSEVSDGLTDGLVEIEATDNKIDTLIDEEDLVGVFGQEPECLQDESETSGARRGTLMHEALQWLPLQSYTKKALGEALDGLVMAGHIKADERSVIRDYELWRFYQSDLAKRMRQSSRLEREFPFSMLWKANQLYPELDDTEDLFLQGIIDAAFIENGAWVLVDYKSDRVKEGETLRERYGVQMRLYKAALERLTQVPVKEVIIYSLALGQEVPVTI